METVEREWYQTEQCSPERSRHFHSNHKPLFEIISGSHELVDDWMKDFHDIVTGEFPVNSEDWERRNKLIYQDNIYQELKKEHDEATGQDRLEKGWYMRQRRWQFYIARDPEKLIDNPETFVPHPPPPIS